VAAFAVITFVAPAAPPARAAVKSNKIETGVGLVALTPSRLLDTRSGVGAPRGPVPIGSTTALTVTGRAGVPASGVTAVMLNVTVTGSAGTGYVTAWPAGAPKPTASNVNFVKGQTVANQVMAKVGTGGKVNLYASAGTQLIVDVAGYFPSGAKFSTLVPARLLDTRPAARPAAGSTTSVTVLGRAGVPTTGVAAVLLTVTAVDPSSGGYLTVFPAGQARPTASNVNYVAKRAVAGLVFAKVGSSGKVSLYTSGSAELLVDVTGWVPTGSDYAAQVPSRIVDTRSGTGATKARIAAGGTLTVQVTGAGGVPVDGVAATEVNLTAVAPTTSGYLTAFPAGVTRPTASVVNYATGVTTANSATVKIGTDGRIVLYSSAATDVLVDVAGSFAKPLDLVLTHDQDTVVVPEAQTTSVTPPTTLGGTGTVTTTGTPPANVGQYVYLPPGGSNGEGVVGKVTAVNGSTSTIQSVPLEEAFASGHIEGSTAPTAQVTASSATRGSSSAVNLSCTGGVTTGVSVTATAETQVAVLADWGSGKTPHLRVAATSRLTFAGNVDIKTGTECTWSSPSVALDQIGPFTAKASWKVKLSVSGAVSTGVSHMTTTTDGFDWWQGQSPTRIHSQSKNATFTPPTAATATVTFGSGPAVSLLLFGGFGPEVSALAYIEVKADTAANPWWTVKLGIKAEASITVDLLFILHAEYTLGVADVYSVEIGRAAGEYPGGGPLAITTSALQAGTVGQPYATRLTASGGAPPYRWGITAGTLPAGLALDGTTGNIGGAPTAAASTTISVAVTDSQGRSTTKTLTIEIAQPAAPTFTQVDARNGHSCGVESGGGVLCWGDNSRGQLGNGTAGGRSTVPVAVTGLGGPAALVSTGRDYGCALLVTGAVKCWGANTFGQLGDGTTTDSAVPTQVTGLTGGVRDLSASFNMTHTCAVLESGDLTCWGAGIYASATDVTVPALYPVHNVLSVSVGYDHACAIVANGGVVCWGNNEHGQLGNGAWGTFTSPGSITPVPVQGLSGVRSVRSGPMHTCGVRYDGTLHCWGYNDRGQLGNGTTLDSNLPGQVQGLNNVTSAAPGSEHTCAALSDGTGRCWGANDAGQLGDGSIRSSPAPVEVTAATSGIIEMSSGYFGTTALLASGSVTQWGNCCIFGSPQRTGQ
jgi:alpha-tubulin suppressor-like RCC1 family protein